MPIVFSLSQVVIGEYSFVFVGYASHVWCLGRVTYASNPATSTVLTR